MMQWKSAAIGNFGSVSALLIDLFDGIMGAPLTMRRQEGMTDE
jgi:hypothetical protein